MRLIGFLAGLVVGVMFLDQRCPNCGPQDCQSATAPLPLISPQRHVQTLPLPARPPARPSVRRAKRPSHAPALPEPCRDRGLLCWLMSLAGPQQLPGAGQPGSRTRLPKPGGFGSFFESLPANH